MSGAIFWSAKFPDIETNGSTGVEVKILASGDRFCRPLCGLLRRLCCAPAAGFDREPRFFHRHLTIARLRDSKGSRALAEQHKQMGFPPQTFTISELVLFRSELSSKGSKHTALSRHELV